MSSAPTIESGVYEASQLSDFATLPSNVGDTVVYYMAITETVDEQEVTTYTKWDVRELVANVGEYKQYRLTSDVWSVNIADWVSDDETELSYECLVNTRVALRKDGAFITTDPNYSYSEMYPVDSFVQAKNLKGYGDFYAAIMFYKNGWMSDDSKVGVISDSASPKDISRQQFEAAMPANARYFVVCSNITSNPYFIVKKDKKIETDVANGTLSKETKTIAETFLTWQFLNTSGGFVNQSSGLFRRTNYIDLDIFKKIVADLAANTYIPQICFYDKNKNFIRYCGIGRVIPFKNSYHYIIEKISDDEKYVVISTADTALENSITFYKYASKVGEDFSNCDLRFTEPRTGAAARLFTSYTLKKNSNDEFLLIFCNGNGGTIESLNTLPSSAMEYFKSHKINIATINHQGTVYGRDNRAWGSDDSYNAHVDLYNYLINEYGFRRDCIIAGGSMGGLTMGQLAYKKPFPIRFCLGVGPAPGLKICFDEAKEHGYTAIANMIRTVYGLALDGSEDADFDEASQGHDWRTMGLFSIDNAPYKVGYPNLYIYYGEDEVTTYLFGGAENYDLIVNALNNAGIYAMSKSLGAVGHADFSAFTQSITDGVWNKELSFES